MTEIDPLHRPDHDTTNNTGVIPLTFILIILIGLLVASFGIIRRLDKMINEGVHITVNIPPLIVSNRVDVPVIHAYPTLPPPTNGNH